MKRREFITLLGGAAAAWPLAARAQQLPLPVIGFLHPESADTFGDRLRAFRQGLKDSGYVEGENVAIVYRWAEHQVGRLPDLATELVRQRVAVIAAAGGIPAITAAKAATTTIPIVFAIGQDPVARGFVASIARPGGNLTGIDFLNTELTSKRMELLRELMPSAVRVAVLVNPSNPLNADTALNEVSTAASAMGLQVQVLNASNSRGIDAACLLPVVLTNAVHAVTQRRDTVLNNAPFPFPAQSGRVEARTGLRMMPTFLDPPYHSGRRVFPDTAGRAGM